MSDGNPAIKVRLGVDVIERLDGARGGVSRSEFVRNAVEQALGGVDHKQGGGPQIASVSDGVDHKSEEGVRLTPKKKVSRKKKSGGFEKVVSPLTADAQAVLTLVRKKAVSSRDAEKHFGWLGIRYRNAERRLMEMGVVRFENGLLVEAGE